MVEYELYQIKIPKTLGDKIRDRLARALEYHAQELEALDVQFGKQRARGSRQDRLILRGRKLSIHNLIRVVLQNGIPAIEDPKNTLALLSKYGIPCGRPREE